MDNIKILIEILENIGAKVIVISEDRLLYLSAGINNYTRLKKSTIKDLLGPDSFKLFQSVQHGELSGIGIKVQGMNAQNNFTAYPVHWLKQRSCLLLQIDYILNDEVHFKDSIRTNIHRINNILTSIIGFARLALEDFHNIEKYIHDIISQAQEATKFSAMLQNKVHNKDPYRCERDVVELTEELKSYIKGINLDEEIHFNITLASNQAFANPVHYNQIFKHIINFISQNYQSENTHVNLFQEYMSCTCTLCKNPIVGDYAVLSVQNTKFQELNPTIFQPGSDLGMYFVKGMVHDHFGHVIIENNSLNLYFPTLKNNISVLPKYDKKILVLDKDATASSFINELLTSNGYSVETDIVSKGTIDRIRDNIEIYCLIIMEQELGGNTGIEISKKITTVNNRIPVIIHSSYQSQFNNEALRSFGITHWLVRPLSAEKFLYAIRNCLSKVNSPV